MVRSKTKPEISEMATGIETTLSLLASASGIGLGWALSTAAIEGWTDTRERVERRDVVSAAWGCR